MTDVKKQISDKLFRRTAWLTLGSLGDKMTKVGKSSVKGMIFCIHFMYTILYPSEVYTLGLQISLYIIVLV